MRINASVSARKGANSPRVAARRSSRRHLPGITGWRIISRCFCDNVAARTTLCAASPASTRADCRRNPVRRDRGRPTIPGVFRADFSIPGRQAGIKDDLSETTLCATRGAKRRASRRSALKAPALPWKVSVGAAHSPRAGFPPGGGAIGASAPRPRPPTPIWLLGGTHSAGRRGASIFGALLGEHHLGRGDSRSSRRTTTWHPRRRASSGWAMTPRVESRSRRFLRGRSGATCASRQRRHPGGSW